MYALIFSLGWVCGAMLTGLVAWATRTDPGDVSPYPSAAQFAASREMMRRLE